MKFASLISAVVFLIAGFIGMTASLFWQWSPPTWIISAVAFTALSGASAESIVRKSSE